MQAEASNGIGATMKPKRTFEQYVELIEFQLGIRLLDWQKTILSDIYNGKRLIYTGFRSGKTVVCQATRMLKEEIDRDTGNLPPRLYELDGYTTDITIYDELNNNKEN